MPQLLRRLPIMSLSYSSIIANLVVDSYSAVQGGRRGLSIVHAIVEFEEGGTQHPVSVSLWSKEPLLPDTGYGFRGTLCHNGSLNSPLTIYVSSTVHFQWANAAGACMPYVPVPYLPQRRTTWKKSPRCTHWQLTLWAWSACFLQVTHITAKPFYSLARCGVYVFTGVMC